MANDCQMPGNSMTDLRIYEKKAIEKGFLTIAGIDEAGRGPLAGPVVSSAVVLPHFFPSGEITDSKKLTPKKRDYLYEKIYDHAITVGIGIVDALEIDRINILQASLLSMSFAVKNLSPKPDYLLIDGTFKISSAFLGDFAHLCQESIIHGDSLSVSIAAASIIAKVTRDRLMEKYHHEYPQYGFSRHKGYPTKTHKEAIKKFGYSPIHRLTFKGVKEYAEQPSEIWQRG